MVTHNTHRRLVVANGRPLHESIVHGGANDHPLHRLVLWSVVKSRCDYFLIQIVVGGTKLNWQLILNPFCTTNNKQSRLHASTIFTSMKLFCGRFF